MHQRFVGGDQVIAINARAVGETNAFANNGGPICNNSRADPGALYNPAGQLVSCYNS
jgi:hypothetical protein